MIIHLLSVQGFKIIGDPLEIHLPEKGRIAIVGPNESGKSTLLEAVDYTLYGLRGGAAEARTDVVTWGRSEARLKLVFSCGGQRHSLQRTITETSHRAKLTPWTGDQEDEENSITSIREIQNRVEEITGMDRDAFEKLVYVRQKDLDALGDLYKSGRTQFLNKVMGIEVFDSATKRVKEDISRLDDEMGSRKTELNALIASRSQYLEKLEECEKLRKEIPRLSEEVEKAKREVEDANQIFAAYEWRRDFDGTESLLRSLRVQLQNSIKSRDEYNTLLEKREGYKAAVENYGQEIPRLQDAVQALQTNETSLDEARTELARVDGELSKTAENMGVADYRTFTPEKILGVRNSRLISALVSLTVGLGLVAAGLLINLSLAVLGSILLCLSVFFFYNYAKLDRLLTATSTLSSLLRQREQQESRVRSIQEVIRSVAKETGFATREGAKARLDELVQVMKADTGQDTVESVKALLEMATERLTELRSSLAEAEIDRLQEEIRVKENELQVKEVQKPFKAESLEYSWEDYEEAKKRALELAGQYTEQKEQLDKKSVLLGQIDRDLTQLKAQFDRFGALEDEVQGLDGQITTLREVILHFDETSKELRALVLPHARFLINQMLPLITESRYSDFQISEDLRFTALSNEAGEYKERELFSGGTQDQFLIALRLAFTQSILDSRLVADKYCLLLDECIASSDEMRRQGIFEVLEAARNVFAQILIVAHEDISNYTEYYMLLGRNRAGHTFIRSKNW